MLRNQRGGFAIMVYLWIFLGLLIATIGLVIANFIVNRIRNKKKQEALVSHKD